MLAQERACDRANGDWRNLRRAYARLRSEFSGTVPREAVQLTLAYSLFEHAVSWKLSPRIVRTTFRFVWDGKFETYARVWAAVSFWAWAVKSSPRDMPLAGRVLGQARHLIGEVADPMSRLNLERMMDAIAGSGPS